MANPDHLKMLERGAEVWNTWRAENEGEPEFRPGLEAAVLTGKHLMDMDFCDADLNGAKLNWADLSDSDFENASLRMCQLAKARLVGATFSSADLFSVSAESANFRQAELYSANLTGARLKGSDFSSANLSRARLNGANLSGCTLRSVCLARAQLERTDLMGADLAGADLRFAELRGAKLQGSNLQGTLLGATTLHDCDLSDVHGLDDCRFAGPCDVNPRTLALSRRLPQDFLRACGVAGAPGVSSRFFRCTIRFSPEDREAGMRLHEQLQDSGVPCWVPPECLDESVDFDPEMPSPGRSVVMLSKVSLENGDAESWLCDVESCPDPKAFVFVRIDDAILHHDQEWALNLVRRREIVDFSGGLAGLNRFGSRNALLRLLRRS